MCNLSLRLLKFQNCIFSASALFLCASLFACAGSENSSENAARARAQSGYQALDAEMTDSQAVAENQNSSSKASNDTSGIVQSSSQEPLVVQLSKISCPEPTSFRGLGVSNSREEAVLLAQKDIAQQIQSSVKAVTLSRKTENVDALGHDSLSSKYDSKITAQAELSNAQDVKVQSTVIQGKNFGVVSCMSRTDAAKPFFASYKTLGDSMLLESATFASESHPLRKHEIYKRAFELSSRYFVVKSILEGINPNAVSSEAQSFDEAYGTMQNAYNEFRSKYSIFYKADGESRFANSLFTRISSAYSVKQSDCESGLLLVAKIDSPSCKDGGFGVNCSVTMNLTGSSCNAEPYFNLTVQVKGNGRYDENEAFERLEKNIVNGDWFAEWRKELDKWLLN